MQKGGNIMNIIKRTVSAALALVIAFSLMAAVYAAEGEEPASAPPALESLDTSAIDGKLIAYRGIETYFVVYPEPLEAETRFDVRNAVITVSDGDILSAEPEKVEEYRFGSVLITGKKLGSATVTVTEPESGVSVSVEVTVIPPLGYYVKNFFSFLEYLPFFIFARIVSIFNR